MSNPEPIAEAARRYVVYAYCEGYERCGHSRLLDMAALISSYPGMTVGELRRRLRCSRCGKKSRSVRLIPIASMNAAPDRPAS